MKSADEKLLGCFWVKMCPSGTEWWPGRNATIMGFLARPISLGRTFRDFVQKVGKVKKNPLINI